MTALKELGNKAASVKSLHSSRVGAAAAVSTASIAAGSQGWDFIHNVLLVS